MQYNVKNNNEEIEIERERERERDSNSAIYRDSVHLTYVHSPSTPLEISIH
jgi:hypothetical protein